MSNYQQGGIQANTDKTDPAWIHSGEPGTSGREPFEDGTPLNAPGAGHHERTHAGYTGNNQSGLESGERGLGGAGLTGTTGEHHHGHHHHQGAGAAGAGLAGAGLTGATGEHHRHHEGSGLTGSGTTGSGLTGSGTTGSGLTGSTGEHHRHHEGAGAAAGAAAAGGLVSEHHSRSHHQGVSDETLGRSGVTGESQGREGLTGTGSGLGAGQQSQGGFKDFDNKSSFNDRDAAYDRVGDRNEGGALYERTGAGGPATGGAAGTDRFDSDRHRHASDREAGDRAYDRATGGDSTGTDSRAGGLLSGITTTDNEFTGKDRSHTGPNVPVGAGAYEDTSGNFKGNTSGPGGNTALTGREGTTGQNPVAQASSTGAGAGEPTGKVGVAHGTSAADTTGEQVKEKPGLMQKIKEML